MSRFRVFPVIEILYPDVYTHHLEAFKKGHTNILVFNGLLNPLTLTNRAASLAPYPAIPGYHRDEYPYASTAQGGKGASVKYVKPRDNMRHGGCLGAFYILYMKMLDVFYVMPVGTHGAVIKG